MSLLRRHQPRPPQAPPPATAWPELFLHELDLHGSVELALRVGGRDAQALIYRRRFRTRDVVHWRDYHLVLERIAQHAAQGQLGWFVDVHGQLDGQLRLTVFDRFFDGHAIRCEARAQRELDGSAEDAVARSAELAAELRARADAENAERLNAMLDDAARADEARRVADERARSAVELERILRGLDG
ncbi:MAG TPA: hypothetical protein VHX88_10835 [Solirubrobacteraceae bacterium]|nr:hypothetical protein [Solirubrobacteraceae bacterium]